MPLAYRQKKKKRIIRMTVDLSLETNGGQREMTQYFSSAKRRELSTQNPTPYENILQEWRENQNIPRQRKTNGFVGSRLTLKEWVKEVLQVEKKQLKKQT